MIQPHSLPSFPILDRELLNQGMNENAKTDVELYEETTVRMSQCKVDSPEFMTAWAERERIKNRHGGMVPIDSRNKTVSSTCSLQ